MGACQLLGTLLAAASATYWWRGSRVEIPKCLRWHCGLSKAPMLGIFGGTRRWGFGMVLEIESIVWDGCALSTVLRSQGERIACTIPREVIHTIPTYEDAVGWEI